MPSIRLGVGPMSYEIIHAIYSYSHTKRLPLLIIPSKNQVDYSSGYVGTTSEFVQWCTHFQKIYPHSEVLLCRDHCGPGFNDTDDIADVYKTIDADIANGFQLIHVDFSHLKGDQTLILSESKRAVEYILCRNPKMKIEIGTEENSGKNFQNLEKVRAEMTFFTDFCMPDFFVCQTGTVVKEIDQAGFFDEAYVRELHALAASFGLAIKEHNADYLSGKDIAKRKGLVSAMNIAPQLGVLQTLLTLEKAKLYGVSVVEFLERSYKSSRWRKWLSTNTSDNVLLCSVIAGHYCFGTPSYKKIIKEISQYEDFSKSVEEQVYRLIDHYLLVR